MRLVYLALGWCAGILAAAAHRWDGGWWGAAGAVLAALTLAAPRRYRWIFAVCAAFCLGGLRLALHPLDAPISQWVDGAGLTLEGVAAYTPPLQGDQWALRLDVEAVTRGGNVLPTHGAVLALIPLRAAVRAGDRVRITGILSDPGAFDTFSYRDYLARAGIYAVMNNPAVEVVAGARTETLGTLLDDVRTRAAAQIASALPEPAASLLIGMALGDESRIAPAVERAFSDTGAAHVIAISGYNMALFSGMIMWALRGASWQRRRMGSWAGIAAIALYTALVGGGAGVERAALMSGLLLAAGALRRRSFLPASMAFSTLVLSIDNPTVLWDLSFQYSLFAVLGIALFADPLARFFRQVTASRLLLEPLSVGLAAQALVVPLVALHFHRLSLVSLPVNLLIAPLIPLVIALGTLSALIGALIPALGVLLAWVAFLPTMGLLALVRGFGGVPFAAAAVYPSADLIAVGYGLVLVGAVGRFAQVKPPKLDGGRWLFRLLLVGSAALVVWFVALWLNKPDGHLHVWVWEGGALMQTPGGAHLLIDGGRYPARLLGLLGDVLPFHKRQIDLWLLTQPDEMRFAALPEVLARYSVGAALHNGQPNVGEGYRRLFGLLAAYPTTAVRAGYTIDINDGVRIEVQHPTIAPELGRDLDDGALIVRVVYRRASVLFAAELSAHGQAEMLDRETIRHATVLHLPGYSAWTVDEAWLRTAAPQVLIASSQPDGQLLAALDAPVFAPRLGEMLHFWTDGGTLWLEPPPS